MSMIICVWVNGELVELIVLLVLVFDYGIIVGDGVFEIVKVVDGCFFVLMCYYWWFEWLVNGLGLLLVDFVVVDKGIVVVFDGFVIFFGWVCYSVIGGFGFFGLDCDDVLFMYVVFVVL